MARRRKVPKVLDLEAAIRWAKRHPRERVSGFACRFPGRYTQAANLARRAIKELGDES